MSLDFTLGKDGHGYYSATPLTSTTSDTALGAATELTIIEDLNVSMSKETTEVKVRGNTGWTSAFGSGKKMGVTFKMLSSTTDSGYTAMLDAFVNNTEIAFWALDKTKGTTGAQGPAGNWHVIKFDRAEGYSDVMSIDVELSPTFYSHWYKKAA